MESDDKSSHSKDRPNVKSGTFCRLITRRTGQFNHNEAARRSMPKAMYVRVMAT